MRNALPYLLTYTFGEYYVWNFKPTGDFDPVVGKMLKAAKFRWEIPKDFWDYHWTQKTNGHCALAGIICEPKLYGQCKKYYKSYLELDPDNRTEWRTQFAEDLDIVLEIEKYRQRTLIEQHAHDQTRNFHTGIIQDDIVISHTGIPLRKTDERLVMTPVRDNVTRFSIEENEEIEIYSIFSDFR